MEESQQNAKKIKDFRCQPILQSMQHSSPHLDSYPLTFVQCESTKPTYIVANYTSVVACNFKQTSCMQI